MASPHSDNALAARTHHAKNPKAATEIQEDPELWRDIQANVRKMDDLYDATFYTWLRSEDNVLVTASYLQRLAGEYDLERIEHALCWLVNGWRLESIAILVKQVTFDWIVTKGDQGEMNRARLMLALTDNWAIQYIARLACTLLTSATVPPPPQPMFRFAPTHTRMASLPGSPIASPGQTATSVMIGVEHTHPYGLAVSTTPSASSPLRATSPSLARGTAVSTPTSPSSSSFNLSTPLPTHGRRMAVSRRLGSPVATPPVGDNSAHLGRPMSTAGSPSPALSVPTPHRSGHYRQSSSTIPGQQARPQDHTQQGSTAMSSFHQSSASVSISTAAPIHPTAQQTSYHPHYCTVSHHHHHAQQQQHQQHQHQHTSTLSQPQAQQLPPQQQEYPSQQQHPLRGLSHLQRNHGTQSHTRQQSQPGTISTSKQNWLLQQSTYSSSPVFYMNKSLFMEELSRKWSFCRLSEFFQCMDPASGISHRFKCKLLKESALMEELSQKQKQQQASATKMSSPVDQQQQQPLRVNHGPRINSDDNRALLQANVVSRAALVDTLPSSTVSGQGTAAVEDSSMEMVMAARHFPRVDASGTGHASVLSHSSSSSSSSSLSSHSSSTSSSSSSTVVAEENSAGCDIDMHPLDTSMDISLTSMPTVQLHQSQSQYRPQPSHSHADYNDDMNSGLSRGCKSTDGNHQHCRAQTVEAIMLNPHGAGSMFPSSTSSSSSSSFSLTSASAASASLSTLSTLTLTESGMESSSSRPLSQPSPHLQHQHHHEQQHLHQQPLSSFASNYSTPILYRHTTTMTAAPVTAQTSVATSAASAPVATSSSSSTANSLSIHSNGNQRHGHDSTSAKRKNSLGVSLTPPSHCSSFSTTSSSSTALHSSADSSLSSSSSIFPGPRRTSTSASTTNEDLKRLRCSRQNSTSSPSGI